jgi:hypothetical protein
MNPSLFIAIIFCAIFVWLGRWLYRHPNKLVPAWGFFNPKHASVQKIARVYATFFIFVGTLGCLEIIAGQLVPSSFAVILGLVLAVASTWLLRPRVVQLASGAIDPGVVDPASITEKQPLLNRHWRRNLIVAAGFMVALTIFVFTLVNDSDVSKLSFATAEVSPILKQRLGEPLKRGFLTSGNIQISGPSGHADIEIPLRGPKGKATLYAVGTKSAGVWKLEVLQAEFEGGERQDLLNQSTQGQGPGH